LYFAHHVTFSPAFCASSLPSYPWPNLCVNQTSTSPICVNQRARCSLPTLGLREHDQGLKGVEMPRCVISRCELREPGGRCSRAAMLAKRHDTWPLQAKAPPGKPMGLSVNQPVRRASTDDSWRPRAPKLQPRTTSSHSPPARIWITSSRGLRWFGDWYLKHGSPPRPGGMGGPR